ncbi:hypothetical protein EYC80_004434 [Monilinia laxa]|uniref:Uncharacterized protein n=1 Tax=Monilinia laxa TaxID=61186 RepID=A0A5N6KMS4_MONLA|nr:hypothetical protein EYC80_004434 [Monilinia laxa]
MASDTSSSVISSFGATLRNKLKDLWELMPENDEDIEESVKHRLQRQISKLEKTILIICAPQENNNDKFFVIEHHEDPTKPINADRQPLIVLSSTRNLLNNCAVFSNIFERKALDADFDSYDMIGYAPSAQNMRKGKFAINEKCIYLNKLMECSFILKRDGYNAIADLGLPQIISYLTFWHLWITRKDFSSKCPPEKRQNTLNVAVFFGASLNSLSLAAARYKLELLEKQSSGSISDSDNDKSGINHIYEGSKWNVHSDNEVIIDDDDNAPFTSLAPGLSRSGNRSQSSEPTPDLSVPSLGVAASMKYVIIMKKSFPSDIEKRLAVGNWEKVYTPSYVRCWKITLAEAAPRFLEILTAIKDSSNDDVGEAHAWDPTVSKEKKPYCLYPQLFHDEVASDFYNDWPGFNEDMDGYIQGRRNGPDILWLAVQFWIRFADTNGVGNPPLSTREELALKSEVVYAMGKCLGASWVLLRRFEATWGRKMKSDDPNNAKRKGPHGFQGPGYYKNKRGPTDPLRFGK